MIYHFFTFIIVYLEQRGSVESILAQKPQQEHLFPVSLFAKPWKMGSEFLRMCKAGVLNFVILRPITALFAFVAEAYGVYGDGELFNVTRLYTYIVSVNSWAQTQAIYCLFLLFLATRSELESIQPVAKFVVVKSVIFITFWQSIAIVIMVHMHVLSSTTLNFRDYNVAEIANGLQEFILCIEMFVAACAHQIAFPASDWTPTASGSQDAAAAAPGSNPSRMSSVMMDVLDLSDVYADVRGRAEKVGDSLRERLKAGMGGLSKPKRPSDEDEDSTELLGRSGFWQPDDEQPGAVTSLGSKHNLPFLAAAGSQRRGRGEDGAPSGAPGEKSPRAPGTVSIGGREVALTALISPSGTMKSSGGETARDAPRERDRESFP